VRELEKEAEHVDPMEAHRASRVSDREDEYKVKPRALFSCEMRGSKPVR